MQLMVWSNTASPAGLRNKQDQKMPLIGYVAFFSEGPKGKKIIKKLRVLTFAPAKQYNFKFL